MPRTTTENLEEENFEMKKFVKPKSQVKKFLLPDFSRGREESANFDEGRVLIYRDFMRAVITEKGSTQVNDKFKTFIGKAMFSVPKKASALPKPADFPTEDGAEEAEKAVVSIFEGKKEDTSTARKDPKVVRAPTLDVEAAWDGTNE